jgi:phosphatidylinositol alpha 1,6-mannosyltransferase
LRIAYFTESLYPHVDGVSRTLARLFATLEHCDLEFRVYSPFQPDETVSWSGGVRPVQYVRFPPYPAYRVSVPCQPGVARDLEGFDPDLIHVVSPTPMAFWAQRYAARRGQPVVTSFHTHFVSYFPYYGLSRFIPLGWRYLRWFHNRCVRTYVPCRSMLRLLEEQGLHRLELWERGVDLEAFSPGFRDDALRQQIAGSRPILLFVGRLVKEKEVASLVEVSRILQEQACRFKLVLVGDGPMRGALERDLPDAYFAGHQTGRALATWYASADLLVFPSTTEAFGNVVQEALASGLPAVVANAGGPADLVDPGRTGLVAPPKDSAAFARHIVALLEDPDWRRRMGRQARGAVTGSDWETINGRLIDSYRRVVAAARRSPAHDHR